MMAIFMLLSIPVLAIGSATNDWTMIWTGFGMILIGIVHGIILAWKLLTWRSRLTPDDFCDRIEVEVEVRLTQGPDNKPEV